MEQLDKYNEQQFETLFEKLSKPEWEKPFLLVYCPQPSWAISVIEQIESEIDAQQIVLDWQAQQIDSFKEYLEESETMEALEQSQPEIVHIVGLENSLLPELLDMNNEVLNVWDNEVELLTDLADKIVIWVDQFTGGRLKTEAQNITDNTEHTISFLENQNNHPKEPTEDQKSQIKQWEENEKWIELGNIYLELDDHKQASAFIQKAISTYTQRDVDTARTYILFGRSLAQQELWQMTLTQYKVAFDIVEESENKDLITEICFRIANIFATHERPLIALGWYEKAIEAGQGQESSPVFVAKSHRNMGILQAQDGDIETSFEHLEKALDGLEESEEWDSLAYTHQQVADIFVNLQQFGDAIEHHQAAAAFFGQIEDHLSQGNNFERIARLSHYKGKMKAAIDYYEKAIEAYKKGDDDKKIADTYQRLGALHQDQLNWAEALASFQGALPHAENLEDDFMIESLKDSIENMEEKVSSPKKKGKGLFGGLFGR